MTPTMARDGMRYWRIAPDPRLRPWISCYWLVEPDPDGARLTTDELQLLIPDGHSEIVFNLGGRFLRWHVADPARRTLMRSSYVIGGRSQSVLTRNVGPLRLAGVKLDPRALRGLIGVPLGEFRDVTLTLADLGCRSLLELEATVAQAECAERLAPAFDAFFLARLSIDDPRGSAVAPLIERILESRGAQAILPWAREHAIDARTLERRFVASMGMTPKQFARIVRFKHTYHRLAAQGRGALKAHLEAYYDESHFNREFRQFLGTSPSKWSAQSTGFRTSVADHLLDGEIGREPLRSRQRAWSNGSG